MDQGSEKWREWRIGGIGSSDAPAIMGVSPWRTAFQVWEEKTRRREINLTGNWATERGQEKEPEARADYELRTGLEMPATLAVHADYPWLRASLDGWNEGKRKGLEIKYVGKDDYELAQKGIVTEKYVPQVQHQCLVTGGEIDFFAYPEEKLGPPAIVTVAPDVRYLLDYFPIVEQFWTEHVLKDKPPELTAKDWRKIPKKHEELVERWKIAKEAFDQAEARLEGARAALLGVLPEKTRCRGLGIAVGADGRKGSIDYSKVPQLKGVDLEPYRKPPTIVTTIRLWEEKE